MAYTPSLNLTFFRHQSQVIFCCLQLWNSAFHLKYFKIVFISDHPFRRAVKEVHFKRVFGHMRTAKAQISLHIGAVWSGPSLSVNRIIGYYRMYERRSKAQMILCTCAGWSEFAHFAHAWRHIFAWRGPYTSPLLWHFRPCLRYWHLSFYMHLV